jgi:YD repeat-containing protein
MDMKNFVLTLLALASFASAYAHECGPDQIVTYINRRAYYEIKADVSESQATVYSLFLNSEPAVASVAPVITFSSFQKGMWVITGNKVGTSIATFHWVYAPNNASGDCIVEIVVKPESEAPPLTGSNHDQSTHGGDPINLYTGELIQQEQPDLNLGGPMPLYFARYYASGLVKDGQVISTLGANWSHNFDDRLNRTDNQIEVITSRGRIVRFEKVGADWILRSSPIVPFQLIEVGTDYRLLDPRDNRIFTFNNVGQLTSISDGKGNTHQMQYSGTVITNVSDGLGRQFTFRYQGHNQLASVSDGTRTIFFGYSFDALEALTSVIDPTGQTIRYVYTGTPVTGPLLLRRTEPEGNSLTTQTYDANGCVITQSFAPGSTNTISYQTNIAIMTDPLGNTRRFEFNTNAALVKAVDEDGKEILYTYDAQGRQTSFKDRRGGVTQFSWHAPSGRVAAIIYPDQTSNTWTHASHAIEGLAVWEQNRFTQRDGAVESLTLNSLGQVTDRLDAGGFHWNYTYDARNQIATEINPAGGGMTNEYNADGALASTSDAHGKVTLTYDALRRVVQHKNADGSFTGFAYDAADRVLRRTNELGGVYVYLRDRNGRVTRQTDPENYVTGYTHDAADRITNISDSRGSTQFGFNARGELSSLTDPDGAKDWLHVRPRREPY